MAFSEISQTYFNTNISFTADTPENLMVCVDTFNICPIARIYIIYSIVSSIFSSRPKLLFLHFYCVFILFSNFKPSSSIQNSWITLYEVTSTVRSSKQNNWCRIFPLLGVKWFKTKSEIRSTKDWRYQVIAFPTW